MAALLAYELLLLLIQSVVLQAQQTYVSNHQLDCYNQAFNSTTKGFICNGPRSCQSYLTFRSASPFYTSPATIGYLLGAQMSATLIASLNNISSDVASIPSDSQVLVPVNCSCASTGQYYQHNASYTLKDASETYFTVANNTYQGLTTCQALMDQNPFGDRNLSVGLDLQVPLRCACPTSNQTALGVKYLLTYMVTWGDSKASIAQLFGVDQRSLLDANELSSTSIIYPFTPILVPLTTKPSKIEPPVVVSPPATPSPETSIVPVGRSNSSNHKTRVYVGVAIGVTLLIVFAAVSGFLFWNRKFRKSKLVSTSGPKTPKQSESADYAALPDSKESLSCAGVRCAIESLTVYRFEDLETATGYFSPANRIKGSVYRASFKGDAAAVKVMKGDVSGEINILKKINHSNIIRLSGFCVQEGNTYLVYEYAEYGPLSDWLHPNKKIKTSFTLAWKQRVQIAYDVADALNYLHNYTSPPYIHKNLNTSNILLDANLRAKIANFGLARTLVNNEDDGLQLTRHVVGTQGYMAPEYIENGVMTPKLDVFAFGVVVLELLSGKQAAAEGDNNAGNGLLSAIINPVLVGENVRDKLHTFVDPSLRDEYPLDLAFSMAQLAQSCVAHDLNARPSMPQVFMTLSKILSSSLDWDPSNELQHSRSLGHGR